MLGPPVGRDTSMDVTPENGGDPVSMQVLFEPLTLFVEAVPMGLREINTARSVGQVEAIGVSEKPLLLFGHHKMIEVGLANDMCHMDLVDQPEALVFGLVNDPLFGFVEQVLAALLE